MLRTTLFALFLLASTWVKAQNFSLALQHELLDPTNNINAIAYSPNGQWVASANQNEMVMVWDASTGDLMHSLLDFEVPIKAVDFSHDNKWLAAGGFGGEGHIIIWEAESGMEVKRIKAHGYGVEHICFSPVDMQLLTAGNDNDGQYALKLWDAESGELLRTFIQKDAGEMVPMAPQFSADGQYVATGIANEMRGIMIWETATGALVKHITHDADVNNIAYHPNGTTIAGACGDNTMVTWNTDGEQLMTFDGLTGMGLAVAFSADGNYLVGGGRDKKYFYYAWDAVTGEEVAKIESKCYYAYDIAFHPNGKQLAIGGYGQRIELYSVTGAEAVAVATDTAAVLDAPHVESGATLERVDKKKRDWYRLHSNIARLIALFPGPPKETKSTDKDGNVSYAYTYDKESQFLYKAEVTDFSKSNYEFTPAQITELMANNYIQKANSEVKEIEFFKVGDAEGRDYVMYTGPIRHRFKIITMNNRLYQLVIASRNTTETEQERKFVESWEAMQ